MYVKVWVKVLPIMQTILPATFGTSYCSIINGGGKDSNFATMGLPRYSFKCVLTSPSDSYLLCLPITPPRHNIIQKPSLSVQSTC